MPSNVRSPFFVSIRIRLYSCVLSLLYVLRSVGEDEDSAVARVSAQRPARGGGGLEWQRVYTTRLRGVASPGLVVKRKTGPAV